MTTPASPAPRPIAVGMSPHPKVAAAAKVSGVLAALFTVLSAVGVVIPGDLQHALTTIVVDVALVVPVAAAYLKRA